MSEKLTGWFPGTTTPARNGVYELNNCGDGSMWAFFDADHWRAAAQTPEEAALRSCPSMWPLPRERVETCWQWRGLADQPK